MGCSAWRRAPRPVVLALPLSFGRILISVIEGVTETNKWDDGNIERGKIERAPHSLK